MSLGNPEISIIVPVYNVETYLKECLDSIKNQTFTDWECILVDDGSPDGSGNICDEYASADARFRVIHQKNGGLSAARNSALSICRGRYVGFVDSDDSVHPEMFGRLYELITSYDADVAQISFESLFTTFKHGKHLVDRLTVLDRPQVVVRLLTGKSLPNYVWLKLFKRQVIDTPFPENMAFEDIYAMAHWAKNIHKMVLSPDILYTYRRRGRSIVNSNYAKNRLDYMRVSFAAIDILHKTEPEVITPELTQKFLWKSVIAAGKNIARHETDPEVRQKAVEKVREMSAKAERPELKKLGIKKWIRAKLLRQSPRTFIKLMRTTNRMDLHRRYSKNKQFY